MKRATTGWLLHVAASDVALPMEPAVAADILDSEAALRAEVKRLRAERDKARSELQASERRLGEMYAIGTGVRGER